MLGCRALRGEHRGHTRLGLVADTEPGPRQCSRPKACGATEEHTSEAATSSPSTERRMRWARQPLPASIESSCIWTYEATAATAATTDTDAMVATRTNEENVGSSRTSRSA